MNGYRNKVSALAGRGKRSEVSLVVNLFQSVLDGFIRAEKKREESEPAKVDIMFSFISLQTRERVKIFFLVLSEN